MQLFNVVTKISLGTEVSVPDEPKRGAALQADI